MITKSDDIVSGELQIPSFSGLSSPNVQSAVSSILEELGFEALVPRPGSRGQPASEKRRRGSSAQKGPASEWRKPEQLDNLMLDSKALQRAALAKPIGMMASFLL